MAKKTIDFSTLVAFYCFNRLMKRMTDICGTTLRSLVTTAMLVIWNAQ